MGALGARCSDRHKTQKSREERPVAQLRTFHWHTVGVTHEVLAVEFGPGVARLNLSRALHDDLCRQGAKISLYGHTAASRKRGIGLFDESASLGGEGPGGHPNSPTGGHLKIPHLICR